MLRHAEDYHHYQISEWDRNLIKLNSVTRPLYVSVFIDGSKRNSDLQILCVFDVCVCVLVLVLVLICSCMQELFCVCICQVCVC